MENFLIVGLGNPGKKYELTRHNAGFLVVDALAKELHAPEFKLKKSAKALTTELQDTNFITLAKPQVFMNLSGHAVKALTKSWEAKKLRRLLLIISDDLDLPLGTLRLREQGGAGGHNGLLSVIESLGTNEFPRLRIGIRPPGLERQPGKAEDFVLKKFTAEELKKLREDVIPQAMRVILERIKPRHNAGSG